ncbi:type II secretion system protein [Bacillus sp. 2205SS5-2]|uniref:type II secretion system protein n=1 Tax=Bacillus sp. 2205SS5-2 TaxID=3109031 RepID=UPI003003C803
MKNSEKGYTLVELLAVIVILGILAMISILAIGRIINHSKHQAFVANAYTLRSSAQFYVKDAVVNQIPVYKVTYKQMVDDNLIEEIVDPFTKNVLESDINPSYVLIKEGTIVSVCLKGETKNLCSKVEEGNVIETPIAYSVISEEKIVDND